MSLHPNTVLLVVVAVILWLAARGRLAALVAALEGKKGGDPLRPSGGLDTTGTGPGKGPSDFPKPGLFLDVAPGSYMSGFSVPGVQALDTSGLRSAGGGRAVADYDYGVPIGSKVHLPGSHSQSYKLLKSWKPGRTVIVETPGGGVMEYLHLNADYVTNTPVGTLLHGGDVVGKSGEPSGAMEAGSGAHLAVVVDGPAQKFLLGGAK